MVDPDLAALLKILNENMIYFVNTLKLLLL